jgi:hypothetical protein
MRKYFNPANISAKSIRTPVDQEIDPWHLLRTFVIGSACYFSWDELCLLMAATQQRSLAKYLHVSRILEERTQTYTALTSNRCVFAHRQVIALLKKYPFKDSDLDVDPRTAAKLKWQACEDLCLATNQRLAEQSELPRWVYQAQKRIASVLGNLTTPRIMKMITEGQHGPGSTNASKGNRVTAYYKFADLPYTVTKLSKLYAFASISSDPKWVDYLESTGRRTELPPFGSRVQQELTLFDCTIVEEESDKVTFVPKDCRTDRPIAVGSSLNMFLQLGIKAELEECLKKVGVDLTCQEKNQEFARLGSLFSSLFDMPNPNQFSTIDLASASDTISIELVKLLLPSDWFAFLDDIRHQTGLVEGNRVTYQKFSAMGNGFTFPLESLIFYGISYGATIDAGFPCTKNDIAVYGDDIIVREKTAPSVISALEWAGFSINHEKSFISGLFKESCGKDYFQGHLVRPFYLKREVLTYEDIYFVCNQLNSKATSVDYHTALDTLYQTLLDSIPLKKRLYGPISSGSYDLDKGGFTTTLSCHLGVPLSYLNSQDLRPWLNEEDVKVLRRKNLISHRCNYQCFYAVYSLDVATLYRVRSDINYMIKLRNSSAPVIPNWHHLQRKRQLDSIAESICSAGSDSRTATRRNSTKLVTQVLPVSNWDGVLNNRRLNKSLIWFI